MEPTAQKIGVGARKFSGDLALDLMRLNEIGRNAFHAVDDAEVWEGSGDGSNTHGLDCCDRDHLTKDGMTMCRQDVNGVLTR